MRTTHSELPKLLAVTRKRSHAFAFLLLFPQVSSAPPLLSSSSSFPLLRHRSKTLKIRVISGGRSALLLSASFFYSSAAWRWDFEESEQSRRAAPRRRPAFTAIYRSISYVDWIRGGFSRVLRLARLRHRVTTTNSTESEVPRSRPYTEVDRARNVLATRFCLKREFHSRIHLM